MSSATYTIMDDDTGKYATGLLQGKSVEWMEETGAENQYVRCKHQFEHGQSS